MKYSQHFFYFYFGILEPSRDHFIKTRMKNFIMRCFLYYSVFCGFLFTKKYYATSI